MIFRSAFTLVFLLTFVSLATARQSARKSVVQTPDGIFTTRENPSALPLPKDEDAFQFIIYGDRTGGEREGLNVLRQAVDDTNLMDPDFVLTVGDLIQGYNLPTQWQKEADEFIEIMSGLSMTWFPVAGNHDIYWDPKDPNRPRNHHEQNYETHFGPLWYSFQHKNTGFIILYSDEGDLKTGEKGIGNGRVQNMSAQQIEFLKLCLQRYKDLPTVFVTLHHPRWIGGRYEGCNWPKIHKLLVDAGNVKAVFAGHIHSMRFDPKDGIEYYALATTGGNLGADLPEVGYLHHFNVVTVRPEGFTVATIPVGTVMNPKRFTPEFLTDVHRVRNLRPRRSADKLRLTPSGASDGQYSVAISNPGKHPIEVEITPEIGSDWRVVPDHHHIVIPPGKTDGMDFHFFRVVETGLSGRQDSWAGFQAPALKVAVDYLHELARIRMPPVVVPVDIGLKSLQANGFDVDLNKCLVLSGVPKGSFRRAIFDTNTDADCARTKSSDIGLKQGPFTLEAWVYQSTIKGNRAVAAKMQASEYGLFLQDGVPHFTVHLNGRYVHPNAKEKIPANQWTHLAGVYDGNQVQLFVNGKLAASMEGSGNRTENSLPLFIGADTDASGNPTNPFAGRLDEVRLSQGVRYAGDFKPRRRFVRDGQTRLLLHLDRAAGPFLFDDSTPAATVIRYGKATIGEIGK